MSLLGEFETEIDALWLAHESNYEVLNEFLPFHSRILQSLGPDESLHRGAESYVLGREKFRKDLVALHVNLQCNADLQKVIRNQQKKRSSSSSASACAAAAAAAAATDPRPPTHPPTHDSSHTSLSAEQLAANFCAFAAVGLKRQLEQPAEAHSRLVDDLAMWREKARRRQGVPTLDAPSVSLPLANACSEDFGAKETFASSSSSSSSTGYPKNSPSPSPSPSPSLIQQKQALPPTPEALMKYRLVCKLQRCAKAACDIVKLIGDEQMPRVLATGSERTRLG